jgi:hypothetical protein
MSYPFGYVIFMNMFSIKVLQIDVFGVSTIQESTPTSLLSIQRKQAK